MHTNFLDFVEFVQKHIFLNSLLYVKYVEGKQWFHVFLRTLLLQINPVICILFHIVHAYSVIQKKVLNLNEADTKSFFYIVFAQYLIRNNIFEWYGHKDYICSDKFYI